MLSYRRKNVLLRKRNFGKSSQPSQPLFFVVVYVLHRSFIKELLPTSAMPSMRSNCGVLHQEIDLSELLRVCQFYRARSLLNFIKIQHINVKVGYLKFLQLWQEQECEEFASKYYSLYLIIYYSLT